MILTIICSLNICLVLYFYEFRATFLTKLITFTVILMISYVEISIFKKLIEKYTEIEFFNGYD